ncbi:MAG TPA: ScyD/ScyE family protein [Tepidisphaeraceae bacterium]|nr:ScyD/ScyE family protein [Tepidisphaeraceae bacterium]
MTTRHPSSIRSSLLRGAAAAAVALSAIAGASSAAAAPNVSVYSTGFNNPRGLKFGPDGMLYVAEGGTGGTQQTIGQCQQVVPPLGPYSGSTTGGRISKVDSSGHRTTVTASFPSSQTTPLTGGLTSGVADIAFIGSTMYALTAGGGCSHGVANSTNGIYRVSANGSKTLIADLSAYQKAHPVAQPPVRDFEPDGTWYSMVAVRGALYAVEPNHGELDKITTSGTISRVADISASYGHIVPTAVAYRGNFYVGNLNIFPIVSGSSKIIKINPAGQMQTAVWGLTIVTGVAFDAHNRMFVLENTVGAPGPAPGLGDIVRVEPSGKKTVVVDGLSVPTAMTFGPDGALYVSNAGFGAPPGAGQILRITGL